MSPSNGGKVHVIIGPMFAGKTIALLRCINAEADTGRTVAMIKSSKDTRYAVDAVVSHDGTKFPCWPLSDLLSFKHQIGVDAYHKVDVIGIDEAQFFGDLYDFCCVKMNWVWKSEALTRDNIKLCIGKLREFGC